MNWSWRWLHSQAHTAKAGKDGETTDDLTAAIAVAEAIRQLQPRVFTLENVPRYQNSQSISIILSALELEGYSVKYSVVNMTDFVREQCSNSEVLKPRTEIGILGWVGAARRRHRNEINLVLLRIWRCS